MTEVATPAPDALAGPSILAGDLSQDGLTAFPEPIKRVLLVWDAPNLDMGLGSILGRRPTALERPRFDALGRWLLGRTADVSAAAPEGPDLRVEPEATVFTNIAPGSAEVVRPWVDALRNVGFAVFAKPKIDEDSDVDRDMLEHIDQRFAEGLAALVVASADGQAFRQPLEEVARAGVPVQV
ncbi:NYN domain-containing protein, partial [Mycobacterium asiaticum]